ADADAGVVEDDVDAAEAAVELLEDGCDRRGLGDVAYERELHRRGIAAERLDALLVPVDDGDSRAVAGEAPRDRGADSGDAAGDEHALAHRRLHGRPIGSLP